jgi:hypothetical protein
MQGHGAAGVDEEGRDYWLLKNSWGRCALVCTRARVCACACAARVFQHVKRGDAGRPRYGAGADGLMLAGPVRVTGGGAGAGARAGTCGCGAAATRAASQPTPSTPLTSRDLARPVSAIRRPQHPPQPHVRGRCRRGAVGVRRASCGRGPEPVSTRGRRASDAPPATECMALRLLSRSRAGRE